MRMLRGPFRKQRICLNFGLASDCCGSQVNGVRGVSLKFSGVEILHCRAFADVLIPAPDCCGGSQLLLSCRICFPSVFEKESSRSWRSFQITLIDRAFMSALYKRQGRWIILPVIRDF